MSGIEFIANKTLTFLGKEEEEEFREIAETVIDDKNAVVSDDNPESIDSLEEYIEHISKSKVHDMLLQL